MSKKSIERVFSHMSYNTIKTYKTAIAHYEECHSTSIEELIDEALTEQEERVPYHKLSIIDRIEKYQEYLHKKELIAGTIATYVGKIKTLYTKCRVELPHIEPLNPKKLKRREYIEFKDILTHDELRCALRYMRPPAKAQAMTMIQGGLSLEECEHLSYRAFIDELHRYHQKDDDVEALEWLATNPVIWVTKMIRVKTGKPYYAVIGSEAVNSIASAKLYEFGLPKYNHTDKLLTISKQSFSRVCREVNKRCNLGLVAEESKLRSHNLRRFHATYIRGSALTYEENVRISNSEIDEMQGRGKTAVQDTYIKTNPLEQKILYAKVMNNVSLYNKYDYEIIDGDVMVFIVDVTDENQKLKKEVNDLKKKLEKKKKASEKVDALRKELGDEEFKELLGEILNAS